MSRFRRVSVLVLATLVTGVAIYQFRSAAAQHAGNNSVSGSVQVVVDPAPAEQVRIESRTGLVLQRAEAASNVAADVASDVAYAHLNDVDKPLMPPRLTQWVASTKPNGEDVQFYPKLDGRSVWIATFDRVQTIGSVPPGSDASGEYVAQVDMVIDADTGQWLWTDQHEVAP